MEWRAGTNALERKSELLHAVAEQKSCNVRSPRENNEKKSEATNERFACFYALLVIVAVCAAANAAVMQYGV